MERQDSREKPGRAELRRARAPEGVSHTGEAGAWEWLGDDYWLPHRVRGSNRGRALG